MDGTNGGVSIGEIVGRGRGERGDKEEGKVEFIGPAFISSSKGNRILVWAETAESRSA